MLVQRWVCILILTSVQFLYIEECRLLTNTTAALERLLCHNTGFQWMEGDVSDYILPDMGDVEPGHEHELEDYLIDETPVDEDVEEETTGNGICQGETTEDWTSQGGTTGNGICQGETAEDGTSQGGTTKNETCQGETTKIVRHVEFIEREEGRDCVLYFCIDGVLVNISRIPKAFKDMPRYTPREIHIHPAGFTIYGPAKELRTGYYDWKNFYNYLFNVTK